ncbi:MAG TPA: TonB family protein [Terriglobia bacterium]|nr:TonB family protein [Terriglobia bacterium]
MRYRAILVGLLLVLSQLQLAAKDAKWFELSSEHFLLFTDVGEVKGRKLLVDFESRVSAFSQVFGKVPPRQFPIEVFLFNNEPDYLETLPRIQNPETRTRSAYLLHGPDRLFIVAKDKSPDDIANDVAHALGHALFERYVLWRPFWLAEGAAEYVRKVGRAADAKKISEEEGFSVADLVTIVPSGTYDDSETGSAFRAQSYLLLRILLDEHPDVLKQYMQSLRTESENIPRIPIDADAMDARLKAYVETPLKAPPTAPAIKSAEADAGRLNIHRGDVLVATGRGSEAGRLYNADSKDARVARAIVARFSRPPLEAVRLLDRVARESPDNGLVQYHFGAMQIQEKKDIQAQVVALERAVQLLPLMGRAYAELSRVYALNGQAERALPMIARALDLEPEFGDQFYAIRADVRLALGELQPAFRDVNQASALPHSDRSSVERYMLKVWEIRKKIENARRETDDRDLVQIRKEVAEKAALLEPPPKPAPPPPPVPTGSISYQIEARAAIEVLEAIYPDYPESLRKKGAAGNIALRVDVGPDGKVKTAAVASSQLPDMDAATLNAVKKWSFKPGNRSIRIIVTYSLQ